MKKKLSIAAICGALVLATGTAFGQTSESAPVEVSLISQKVIPQGDRAITLNVVTPPPELMSARPPVGQEIEAAPLSQEQLQELQEADPPKPVKSLIVEGSAYSTGITEFRWSDSAGAHRAFSNVDFTLFSAMTVLEGADSIYQFTFLVSRSPGAVPPGVPDASEFSNSQAEYMPVAGQEDTVDPQQKAAAFTPFDALHSYFDSAKADLMAARAANDDAQAAKEQELRDHPPQPQNVTINFWPKRGSVYLQETPTP